MLLSHTKQNSQKVCTLNYATYFDKAEVLNFKIDKKVLMVLIAFNY
jgi:hypothetical protein